MLRCSVRRVKAPRPLPFDEGKVTVARVCALEALAGVEAGDPADDALGRAFERRAGMAAADRALAMELCYGVLRWRRRLDDAIAAHCTKGLPVPPLLDVLRLAAYQLVFLEVPPHAAVSTAVEAARATKGKESAAKFANAVLRAVAQDAVRLRGETPPAPGVPREVLARGWSFPDWMVDAFAQIGGDLAGLLAASNERPPLVLRAAPGARDALVEALGVGARAGRWAADAVVADGVRGGPAELPGFREGRFAVQDEGAQLVTALLGDVRGRRVLDLCAAPGGKAIHAAQLGARVTAVDASAKRLVRVTESATRLGVTLETVCDEARVEGVRALEGRTFDAVLVDAPCSGTGIVRRKPDVKWARGPEDVARLAERQAAILEGATRHLAPGCTLVYAVCSLLPAEGERVVSPFLARHPELVLVPAPDPFRTTEGFFRTRPDVHGTDGFFAAAMRRT